MSLAPVVRPWLRPGFALVATQEHWYVCDPLGRIRALRQEVLPAGLRDPRAIDPDEHRDFLADLAAAGIAATPGRGRGLDRRTARRDRVRQRSAVRRGRTGRGLGAPTRIAATPAPGPSPTAAASPRLVAAPSGPVALVGGPPEFTRPLTTLLGRRGIAVQAISALPAEPPPAGSWVVWAGPEPFGPAAERLDAAAGRGELSWVRLTVDGRWVDLEPVARAAGDVTHAMTRQRRLAAERRPAIARARWSGAAVRGPSPITPAVGRLLAGLVAAELDRPGGSPAVPPARHHGSGRSGRSGQSHRSGRAGRDDRADSAGRARRPPAGRVDPRFRLRRIDLLTGAGTDHWILPVPAADLRAEPA